jgi:hypothetical protein
MATGHSDHDQLLPTLLEICEDFFGRTSPATRRELDTLLRERGITAGPGWLIDMLGLTRLHPPAASRHHSEQGPRHDT